MPNWKTAFLVGAGVAVVAGVVVYRRQRERRVAGEFLGMMFGAARSPVQPMSPEAQAAAEELTAVVSRLPTANARVDVLEAAGHVACSGHIMWSEGRDPTRVEDLEGPHLRAKATALAELVEILAPLPCSQRDSALHHVAVKVPK